MEINAVLACLQPNYLLCPSRPSLSSSFPAAAAATFLPLSSSQRTRFSPPQLLKVTSLIVLLLLLLHFLLDSLFFLLNSSSFLLQLQKQVLASASGRNGNETTSAFRSAAVLSDSYRYLLFVFFHCCFILFLQVPALCFLSLQFYCL